MATGGERDLAQLAVDPEADAVGYRRGSKCRSDARMLMASISIFCRKRTTGASSTSAATSRRRRGGVFLADVELEVAPASDDPGSRWRWCPVRSLPHQLVVLDDHPLGRELGGELDALGRPWSVGGAAMNRRLPRLPSTTSWYWPGVLGSTMFFGSFCGRPRPGPAAAAKRADSVCARSDGGTAPSRDHGRDEAGRLRSRRPVKRLAALVLSLPAPQGDAATPDSAGAEGHGRVSGPSQTGRGSPRIIADPQKRDARNAPPAGRRRQLRRGCRRPTGGIGK